MHKRIILVRFLDGDEIDHETYGPFPDRDAAWAWADRFQRWFDGLEGGRVIDEMFNLPIQPPHIEGMP